MLREDFTNILKSAITGEKYSLSKDINIEELFDMADKHSVIPLAFEGAFNCGLKLNDPGMMKLFNGYCSFLSVNERQMFAFNNICEAFNKKGIDFMPLKGCNMKSLYPKPELRVMGDADILIKEEQYDEIEKVMNDIGFKFEFEGDHDYAWDSHNLHVELHYRLLVNYNSNYEMFFGNGWKLASKSDGHRFCMKPEDEFIYMFCHFFKHYINAGIGCRHVVDLWVYLRNHKDMNYIYTEETLSKLGLGDFYKSVIKLINVWFGDEKADNITEVMTEFIMNCGSWGNVENMNVVSIIKASDDSRIKGRIKVVMEKLFLPFDGMKHKYKILGKHPVLLPVMWIHRAYVLLFKKGRNVSYYTSQIKNICKGDVDSFGYHLETVGIDLSFIDNKFYKKKMLNKDIDFDKR